ncbi:lipoprotein [Streptomyces broussonetiae]|uniref:Lipoprotein n=1 Tax=Streptomyces broussonetiae TaxID=2686304 RepID=A0ABV5EGK0_9ACTN
MRFGAGRAWHGGVHPALLVAVLAGCGAGDGEERDGAKVPAAKGTATSSAAASAPASGPAAVSGGTLGGAGSACELPVTFELAGKWTAEAVEVPLEQGPVALVCEVDAKPAGSIGFLRVWTGEPGEAGAREVLEGFLAAQGDAGEEEYGAFTADGLSGAEVAYRYTSEFLDGPNTEHALAVTTPDGPVVVHLGGLDDAEHRDMLPAYELARRTLRGTGG